MGGGPQVRGYTWSALGGKDEVGVEEDGVAVVALLLDEDIVVVVVVVLVLLRRPGVGKVGDIVVRQS